MATRSNIIRAKRKAVGGKRDRCRKGKSCSAACINRNRMCLVEAPTPVAGALPRAVKAVQTRKRNQSPQEQRQVSQRRKEFVKRKVAESTRLREERLKYVKDRNSLRVQLRRAMYLGDTAKIREIRGKLEDFEESVGSRLKIPKSEQMSLSEALRGFSKAQASYRDRMYALHRKMELAAGSEVGTQINRRLYGELEGRFMKLVGNGKSLLAGRANTSDIREFQSFTSKYKKGDTWNYMAEKRKTERSSKLRGVFRSLVDEAEQAAKNGDLKKYKEAEKKFLKIGERAKDKLGIPDHQIPKKGSVWLDTRVSKVLVNLRGSMESALSSGNLDAYNKAEAKFLRIRDKYMKGETGSSRRDKLFVSGGGPKMFITKGQALAEFQGNLEVEMRRKASSKSRGDYNRLEGLLMKLDPQEKKGRIWRSMLDEVVKSHMVSLRSEMRSAALTGDRKKYVKAERVLLRLDPTEKKNEMWREGRIRAYVPTVESKLRKAASEGDRRTYNKLEKTLYKLDPNYPKELRGKVWVKERVNEVAEKLRLDLDKAIRDNDRAAYDRLEARFLRIRSKVGAATIRDYDLRYMVKGELWREAKGKTMITDLESLLNKGRREGVGEISIKGTPSEFELVSRVLGNKLAVSIAPNDSTSFTVNDSYTASDNLSKKETIAIIREVKRQYNEVMANMEDGTVFKVSAASGDGRQDMRTGAYTGYGFSSPDSDGYMYGRVRGGKIEAIDEDEYYDSRS